MIRHHREIAVSQPDLSGRGEAITGLTLPKVERFPTLVTNASEQ